MALAERLGTAVSSLSGRRSASFPALLNEAFEKHEREGRRLQLQGRVFALTAIFFLVAVIAPYPDFIYYQALILIFMATAFIPTLVERFGRLKRWHLYAFVALDFAFMTFMLLYPNPLSPSDYPPQFALRFQTSIYFFVFLSSLAFSDQPKLVLWGGFVGIVCWLVGTGWLASLPGSVIYSPLSEFEDQTGMAERIQLISNPRLVDLSIVTQTVVVFGIVAMILAAGVMRSRRLVWRYASIERQRMNLARYFPPATVEHLANQDEPLGQIRELQAAIIFADIVGFTRWAERHTPSQAISMLREVHSLLEEAVFRHGGTLDKFIGDGVMVTFGTPEPTPRDSVNALSCIRAIVADIGDLNARRTARGDEPVQVALGAHYGPVVVGNIGTERRLELGVIGDTVNVASRLEELTRVVGRMAIISDDLVADIKKHDPAMAEGLLREFEYLGANHLDGRRQDIAIWASLQTIQTAESRSRWARHA